LVKRVLDQGWSVRAAAESIGISARRAYVWLARDRDLRPDQPRPIRTLLGELEPARIDHLLHQVVSLRSLLGRAKKVGETSGGTPVVRCLEFTYAPRVPARIARRLKIAEGRLKLWVNADGPPLRSELAEHWAGRAGRIAPLEQGDHAVATTYTLVHGWLVASERRTEDRSDDSFTRNSSVLHLSLQL
jgi:hypothetical protein